MSEREFSMLQVVTYSDANQSVNEVYKWEEHDFVVIGQRDGDNSVIIGNRPEHLRELARLLEIAANELEQTA